jgi:hypothetical protein
MSAGLSFGQYVQTEIRVSTTEHFVTIVRLPNKLRRDQFVVMQQK